MNDLNKTPNGYYAYLRNFTETPGDRSDARDFCNHSVYPGIAFAKSNGCRLVLEFTGCAGVAASFFSEVLAYLETDRNYKKLFDDGQVFIVTDEADGNDDQVEVHQRLMEGMSP